VSVNSECGTFEAKILQIKIMKHILYGNRYNSELRHKCWNVHFTSHLKKMKHTESEY
jgi:hypothetical protein